MKIEEYFEEPTEDKVTAFKYLYMLCMESPEILKMIVAYHLDTIGENELNSWITLANKYLLDKNKND